MAECVSTRMETIRRWQQNVMCALGVPLLCIAAHSSKYRAVMGHGFHEDGLVSAMRVAEALGAAAPWSSSAQVAPQPGSIARKRTLRLVENGIPAASG